MANLSNISPPVRWDISNLKSQHIWHEIATDTWSRTSDAQHMEYDKCSETLHTFQVTRETHDDKDMLFSDDIKHTWHFVCLIRHKIQMWPLITWSEQGLLNTLHEHKEWSFLHTSGSRHVCITLFLVTWCNVRCAYIAQIHIYAHTHMCSVAHCYPEKVKRLLLLTFWCLTLSFYTLSWGSM